jgi:penicillin-binding protein 1A
MGRGGHVDRARTGDNGGHRRRRGALVGTLLTAALVGGGCSYTPAEVTLLDPDLAQSSRIYTADGTLLTTLRAEENRESIRLVDLPDHVPDAVVAIEDARFWNHRGVDVKAIFRAGAANARAGDVVEGGSTITQQYVKTAMLDPEQTMDRKVEEALLAVQLERRYSKERILELYLNTIYFGNGAYGIQAAAEEYFGVPAKDLSLAEAATLAGLIRAPSAYDPHDNAEDAVVRRDQVIKRMVELDLVEEATGEAASAEPLELTVRPDTDHYPAGHFVERVKRFVLDDPRFGETPSERRHLLFAGGLRITTTLDLEMQLKAEEAVARVRPAEGPEAALVSMEPQTGFVRAHVGGRDFFGGGEQAKLDLATGGTGRAAGSSFKPLVLAAALEEGVDLDAVYPSPTSIEIPLTNDTWKVGNYEGSGGGRSTLREATAQSSNTVYAQLMLEVGPADAVSTAAKLGIESPLCQCPSTVLGTNDVHPLEMTTAYATFANRGVRVDPTFVTKVARSDGTVLYQHRHAQERVLDSFVADQVNDVLQDVVSHGTGINARIGRPAAGKTGTGQKWTDAWFVGHTPDLATAVWMGFPEGSISMVPPTTPFRITGGSWPAQIWQLFMTSALADVPVSDFPVPTPPEDVAAAPDAPPSNLQTVRDVVGMPFDPAQAALSRDGFIVRSDEVYNDQYPPGYVVGQSPVGGEGLPGGSTVVLHVGNGRSPATTAPEVLGLDEEAAVAAISDALLEPVVVVEQEAASLDAEQRRGLVWKQSPAGGEAMTAGAPVTVWVNPVRGLTN